MVIDLLTFLLVIYWRRSFFLSASNICYIDQIYILRFSDRSYISLTDYLYWTFMCFEFPNIQYYSISCYKITLLLMYYPNLFTLQGFVIFWEHCFVHQYINNNLKTRGIVRHKVCLVMLNLFEKYNVISIWVILRLPLFTIQCPTRLLS